MNMSKWNKNKTQRTKWLENFRKINSQHTHTTHACQLCNCTHELLLLESICFFKTFQQFFFFPNQCFMIIYYITFEQTARQKQEKMTGICCSTQHTLEWMNALLTYQSIQPAKNCLFFFVIYLFNFFSFSPCLFLSTWENEIVLFDCTTLFNRFDHAKSTGKRKMENWHDVITTIIWYFEIWPNGQNFLVVRNGNNDNYNNNKTISKCDQTSAFNWKKCRTTIGRPTKETK